MLVCLRHERFPVTKCIRYGLDKHTGDVTARAETLGIQQHQMASQLHHLGVWTSHPPPCWLSLS